MLYNIIILEPSTMFYVLCDCVTMIVTVLCNMWQMCDIMLILNFKSVIGCFRHEQFLFSFSFIFWLYRDFVFFFFFFSFRQWRGTWHCSHMTCHIMWCHRPRRWWKDLEDNVRAYIYNMMTLRRTWGRSMDIRAGLIISSTYHEDFVYIGL